MSLPASQRGFTLIELVAIIVIMGALASVAVPKYYDLTREAHNRAALQAVMEGKARLTMQYARLFLNNGSQPDVTSVVNAAGISTSVGDYMLNFAPVDTLTIKVNASGRGGVQGTNSGVWQMPR
jgi:prepilin-type N-terminal cleavage/methylation domain-containing protein